MDSVQVWEPVDELAAAGWADGGHVQAGHQGLLDTR